jgi:uncharacterized membrane protein (Fun14 family)
MPKSGDSMIEPLVFQMGVGGAGGFLAGYAVKKIAKILAFFAGLYFLSLIYLSQIGVVNINYERFLEVTSGFVTNEQVTNILLATVASLPFAASFVAGLIFGLKKG